MGFESPKFEQPKKPEEAKEKIESEKMLKMIEDSSILSPSKKLDMATFLLYDKKKVAYLGDHKIIEPEDDEEALRKEFSEEIEEIKKVLKDSGLPYDMAEDLKVKDGILGFNLVTAKNKEDLDKFLKVEKENNDREMGLLLGYPETAVDVYDSRDFVIFEKLPEAERKKLEDERVLKFAAFSPSRVHWKEELEEVRKIQSLIKQKSPGIYKQIMESDL